MEFTTLETQILMTLRDILMETECVYSDDLVRDNPKKLRGALASLISKKVIHVDYKWASVINGKKYYPVYWDTNVLETVTGAA